MAFRTNKRLLGGVLALLALAVVVVLVWNSGGTPADLRTPAGRRDFIDRAAGALARASAIRYTGPGVQLTVTRDGWATGTLSLGGASAAVLTADGSTYVKAGQAFWRANGAATHPEYYAGRWSRTTSAALGLDPATLTPAVVAQRLRNAVSVTEKGALIRADDLQLSALSPYSLLNVGGLGAHSLSGKGAYDTVRAAVSGLAGALDPAVRFPPDKALRFQNCGAGGCTLSTTVTATGALREVTAAGNGTIFADGLMLGGCTDGGPLGAGRTVTLSCRVTGAAWDNWLTDAQTIAGDHHYWAEFRVLAQSVSATDVARLQGLVDQQARATGQ